MTMQLEEPLQGQGDPIKDKVVQPESSQQKASVESILEEENVTAENGAGQQGKPRQNRRQRSYQSNEIKIKRRGTPLVAYTTRVQQMLEAGQEKVRLTAAGPAVDRAFAIAQEVSIIMAVHLAMSTREVWYQHPEGDYPINIHTITVSKKPITHRQKVVAQALAQGQPIPELQPVVERRGRAAQQGGEAVEGEANAAQGEQQVARNNRGPGRRQRGPRGIRRGPRAQGEADESKGVDDTAATHGGNAAAVDGAGVENADNQESGEQDSGTPPPKQRRERRWRPPRGGGAGRTRGRESTVEGEVAKAENGHVETGKSEAAQGVPAVAAPQEAVRVQES